MDKSGVSTERLLFDHSQKAARFHLGQRGLAVAEISSVKSTVFRPLTWRTLTEINEQLSIISAYGMASAEGLRKLADDISNRYDARQVRKIADKLASGEDLTAASEMYPPHFAPLYTRVIESATANQTLPSALNGLRRYCARGHEMQRFVLPAICIPLAVVLFMLIVVAQVPEIFESFYDELGVTPPVSTRLVMGTSEAIRANGSIVPWAIYFVSIGALAYWWDVIVERLPGFGRIYTAMIMERFCRLLALLINAGVDRPEGLHLAANACGSPAFERKALRAMALVANGQALSEALILTGFPPAYCWVLMNCPSDADVARELSVLADSFERRSTRLVPRAIEIGTVVGVFSMGIVVGGLVISLFMPILGLSSAV